MFMCRLLRAPDGHVAAGLANEDDQRAPGAQVVALRTCGPVVRDEVDRDDTIGWGRERDRYPCLGRAVALDDGDIPDGDTRRGIVVSDGDRGVVASQRGAEESLERRA